MLQCNASTDTRGRTDAGPQQWEGFALCSVSVAVPFVATPSLMGGSAPVTGSSSKCVLHPIKFPL